MTATLGARSVISCLVGLSCFLRGEIERDEGATIHIVIIRVYMDKGLNAEPHQNIVTVACLFTHLPTMHSFFLDAIEEIYNEDASLSIHLK